MNKHDIETKKEIPKNTNNGERGVNEKREKVERLESENNVTYSKKKTQIFVNMYSSKLENFNELIDFQICFTHNIVKLYSLVSRVLIQNVQ